MHDTRKRVVVNFLNASRPFREFPYEWKLITPNEREDLIKHLVKLGLLDEFAKKRADLRLISGMQCAAERASEWQRHDGPNGGNRILPSGYAALREHWRTGAGERVLPQQMRGPHLDNALKLLKESNGNCVAKCTSILGTMRKHFRNSGAVCALLDKLCVEMQQVEVDEQYPIFAVMAATLASRQHTAKVMEAASDYEDYHDDIPF
jgi:hypothetical protein